VIEGVAVPRRQANRPKAWWAGLAAGAALMALSACGGGDSDAEAPETSAPDFAAIPATSSSSTTVATTTTTTQPPLQLTANAKLSTAGLGPVRVGMTVEEGERVSGVTLVADDFGDQACRYYTPDRGPDGVAFMVSSGEIVRVDITSGTITTLSGYGIGSTKDEIVEAFGDRIETTPHPFTDGEYVVFVPVDEVDSDKRVLWETDAEGVVTAIRAGRQPFVDFTEGCA